MTKLSFRFTGFFYSSFLSIIICFSSNPELDSSKRISTLTASLATLTSEKSRLETSFQEDKKKLRSELTEKEKSISTLKQELKQFTDKSRSEIDDAKSKLIIERHNREKEV